MEDVMNAVILTVSMVRAKHIYWTKTKNELKQILVCCNKKALKVFCLSELFSRFFQNLKIPASVLRGELCAGIWFQPSRKVHVSNRCHR